MDAAVAGMCLMAEGERLERRTVPKIERQVVQERQTGGNSDRRDGQSANEPRFFHAVHQGE
jgi:hypothetical protein